MIAFAGTSLGLFLAGGLVMMLIFALLRRYLFRGDDISTASALGGGFIGALVGVLLAISIVWSFAFVRDMKFVDTAETATSEHSSGIEKLANRLTGSAVSAAMSAGSVTPELARISGALAAAPAQAMQRIQRIMKSPEFLTLVQEERNQRVLNSGNPELVQRLPAFRALAVNSDLLALAEMSGLVDDDLDAKFARQLTLTWERAHQIKNDPRVQAIVADPEFQAALESDNPVNLLTNQQLHELADIIFADEFTATPSDQATADTGAAAAGQLATSSNAFNPPKEPTEIHQWTDSSGRIHYSDKKPE